MPDTPQTYADAAVVMIQLSGNALRRKRRGITKTSHFGTRARLRLRSKRRGGGEAAACRVRAKPPLAAFGRSRRLPRSGEAAACRVRAKPPLAAFGRSRRLPRSGEARARRGRAPPIAVSSGAGGSLHYPRKAALLREWTGQEVR